MKLPLLLAALLHLALLPVSAQPAAPAPAPTGPLTCVVCAKSPLVGKYFVHNKTNFICVECEALPARCSICSLPAREGFSRTPDGRVICRRDFPNVILNEAEGVQLLGQARSELGAVSEGLLTLRAPDVVVKMFDVDYWNPKGGGDAAGGLHKLGFSSSRAVGGGGFIHNVILLSGRPRNQTLSTCAHEFGHLWLNENLAPGRTLDPDTREALCELLAYKLAARRKDTNEVTRLKENTYTKGVILNAIEFEAREGMPGVVAWVRNRTESALPAATGIPAPAPVGTTTAAAPSGSAPAAAEPPRELRPPPPPATKLELRSLLRSSKRTVAVINGERFEPGSEISLLIAGKRHLVRMEEAQENSVIVTVDGAKQTLRLGEK